MKSNVVVDVAREEFWLKAKMKRFFDEIKYLPDLSFQRFDKIHGKFAGKFVEIRYMEFFRSILLSVYFFFAIRDTNKKERERDTSVSRQFSIRLDSIDCIDLLYDQNYMVYLTGRNTQHYIDNPRHEFAGILVQHYNTELTRN